MNDDRARPSIVKTAEGYEIRASALNLCPRALALEYVTGEAPEPGPWLRRAMQYGVDAQDRLLLDYFEPSRLEVEVRTELQLGRWRVVGHADAMHYSEIDYDRRVVEVKTTNSDITEEQARAKWGRQIAAYVHGAGAAGALLVVENRVTKQTKLFALAVVDLPTPEELEQWLLDEVEPAIEKEDPALARCTCKRCGRRKVAEEDAEDLREALEVWAELTREIEELEARRQSIREWLESVREWTPDEKIELAGVRVMWMPPTEARVFDSRRHQAEHPECHERYMTTQLRKGGLRISLVRKEEA